MLAVEKEIEGWTAAGEGESGVDLQGVGPARRAIRVLECVIN
jgi:hypothetical protein